MKVWVLMYTFWTGKIFLSVFLYFLRFFEKISFSEKNTVLHNRFHSQILLYDQVFWQFSTPRGYLDRCGKLQNHSKIAPGGLWNRLYNFFPEIQADLRQRRFTLSPLRKSENGQNIDFFDFFCMIHHHNPPYKTIWKPKKILKNFVLGHGKLANLSKKFDT